MFNIKHKLYLIFYLIIKEIKYILENLHYLCQNALISLNLLSFYFIKKKC